MSLNAIDFSGSIINFRFIDINASVTINLEDTDIVFIPGFSVTDSISRINIPVDYLTDLFLFKISVSDFNNSIWSNITYAMGDWTDISFALSKVITSKAINPNAQIQYLKYDYVRYILKTITGSDFLNGLFRNKDELLTKVIALDSSFNTNIVNVLLSCGTTDAPKDNTTYTNNPCHLLIDSILAQDNVLETDNIVRRLNFLTSVNTKVIDYSNNSINDFSVYGTLFNTNGIDVSNNGNKYYYPLYINRPDLSYNYVFSTMQKYDGSLDIDISNITFYAYSNLNERDASNAVYSNYYDYYNYYYSVPFEYGDSLSVRLTYKQQNSLFLGKEILDRSYEVYLDVGMESVFNTSYDASGSEHHPAIVNNDIPQTYQSNGLNTSFQYVFYNASPPNLYLSPYNFYPTLSDISEITFTTNVTLRDSVNLIIADPSLNDTSHNWFFSIFTRPRNNGLTNAQGIGFDRFNSVPIVTTFGIDCVFNLSNLVWNNTLNSQSTWFDLVNMPVMSTTPYGVVNTNGDQQIMALSIGTSYTNFNGIIKNVSVTFNDGRVINMI